MSPVRTIAVFLLLLAVAFPRHADAATAGRTSLNASLEVLEDPDGLLPLSGVTGSARGRFVPLGDRSPSFGFSKSAYWVRFRLPVRDAQAVLLEIDYRGLDDVSLYLPGPDGYLEKHSGDLLPFSNREIAHRLEVFSIPAESAAWDDWFYLRVESKGPIVFPLIAWTPEAFAAHDREERFVLGMYYGAIAVMLLYHLLLFFSLRDRNYLSFVFFILGFAAAQLIENGLAFELLWPEAPRWDNLAFPVAMGLTGFWALAFAKGFLRAERYAPRLKRLADALSWVSLILAAASFILPYGIALQSVSLLSIVVIATAVLATVSGIRHGSRAAVFFALAWSGLLLGGLLAALANFGLLAHSFATYYGAQAGAIMLVVLLALGMADRINTLRLRKEQAELDSVSDGLTGIPNRRRFDEYLESEWQRAVRARSPLALILVDLDYFHDYNALYGHVAGDECLRAVAAALKNGLNRPADFISRYGGEEFAIVLPSTDAQGAAHVAEKLCRAVAALNISHDGSEVAGVVTATFGVAAELPTVGASAAKLVLRADNALYEAKRQGRNRVGQVSLEAVIR